MTRLSQLIVPALAGTLALATGWLPFKLAVPGFCALILLGFRRRCPQVASREIWAVVAAFAMSMVGDYFLSNRRGHPSYFETGIAAFFLAHLGYLRYSLLNGRMHWLCLAGLLVLFLPYFALALSPRIASGVLWLAVLLYLLISCVGLAAAAGLNQPRPTKSLYLAGIGLVVFSDTIISLNEFLKYRALNWWILPTYYLAHLTITASILLRPVLSRERGGPAESVENPPSLRAV